MSAEVFDKVQKIVSEQLRVDQNLMSSPRRALPTTWGLTRWILLSW
jgi:hypothetical protein